MASPKIIDLDAELGFDDEPLFIKQVKVLGIEVRVVCDLNRFGLYNVTGDGATAGDLMKFLESMIHPEDWPGFASVASRSRALSGEKGDEHLATLIQKLMAVAAERPTKQPSDLPRGGSTRSTGRKSAASSTSVPAKASTAARSR